MCLLCVRVACKLRPGGRGLGSRRCSECSRPLASVLEVRHSARMRIEWNDLEAILSCSSTLHQRSLLFLLQMPWAEAQTPAVALDATAQLSVEASLA